MIYITIAIIIAYLIGAIPTGYIFARAMKGIDIRQHGSGNVGATNVVRTVGMIPGIIVLILDLLKGVIAVVVLPVFLFKFSPDAVESGMLIRILLGAAAISGHVWPCFLKFKGGKGVATTAGVMIGLSPGIFLGCFGIWIIIFAIWKYVSLASIIAAIALPVFSVVSGQKIEFTVFCATLCVVGVYVHRSNIKRLIQGTESKVIKVKKS
jgi:glycerol-3-phosphate acyltransferase PlsY